MCRQLKKQIQQSLKLQQEQYQLLSAKMNQDILNILKKYKQSYDLYNHRNNKENFRNFVTQGRVALNLNKQGNNNTQAVAQKYELIIDNIIADGRKVFQCYQQILNESAQQYEALKEQMSSYKLVALEQKRDHEVLVDFLNKKVKILKEEISHKQQQMAEMMQKCEQYERKVSEVHNEQREKIENIHEELIKSSMHYESKITCSNKQIDEVKKQLQEQLTINEQLLNENYNLKNLNEIFIKNIEYLKNKLDAQKDVIHQTYSQSNELPFYQYSLPKECNNHSLSSIEQERYMFQEEKMNRSNECYTNGEKEILNLSEHYSKFNRTEEFHTKEKSNYEFILMDSDEGKSFLRKKDKQRDTALQKPNYLVKINSRSTNKDNKQNDERPISEIKEFKMSQNACQDIPSIDPYLAFFKLLVQCQKFNSKYFDHISHIDVNYLYKEFYQKSVPYFKWQLQIRKVIDAKVLKSFNKNS